MKAPGALVLMLALSGLTVPADAQVYPAGPVRLIVPFPPGGTADPVARAGKHQSGLSGC